MLELKIGCEKGAPQCPLQVHDRDFQLASAACEVKRGGIEFGRPEVSSGVVGRADAFAWDPHEICVQPSIGVLVVDCGDGVGSLGDA